MRKLSALCLAALLLIVLNAYAPRGTIVSIVNDGNNKFGRNSDIDTASGFETIWDGGGVWVPPTAARIHDIASTDADDDDGGNGANTIRVFCIDSNWDKLTEDVTMDGLSNVAMTNACWSIYRMFVLTAGSSGANEGNITATAQTDATVTAQITNLSGIGFNQTLMAAYTVPRNTTLYLSKLNVGMNRSVTTGSGDFALWVKEMTTGGVGVWQLKDFGGVVGAGASTVHHEFDPPLMVQGPAHVRLDGDSSANDTDMIGRFAFREY